MKPCQDVPDLPCDAPALGRQCSARWPHEQAVADPSESQQAVDGPVVVGEDHERRLSAAGPLVEIE